MYLEHYGTPRHSGRYPWGSGDNPYQREQDFLGYLDDLKKDNPGVSDKQLAKLVGMTTNELRARRSAALSKVRAANVAEAKRLRDKGVSQSEIARRFEVNESVIRSWLKEDVERRATATQNTADVLKESIRNNKYIDIGPGNEVYLGITETRLKSAVQMLRDQGYEYYTLQVTQLGTGYKTTRKVLCAPGTSYAEMAQNQDKIGMPIGQKSEDNGLTFLGIKPPVAMDPSRVTVRYKEDGGEDRDGVILLKPGVDDLSLGQSRYAQVRIQVGDGHYLKGMAMYGDPKDFPEGTDIIFNTNKTKGTPMLGEKDDTVLKNLKDDPDNPFGATISQREYLGKDGKMHQSPINIVGLGESANEEGNWGGWSKDVSSQVLAKQPVAVAKKQLGIAYKNKEDEFNEIMSLTNPAVKQKLLESFADECDGAAVHLEGAGFPRQQWHVILPFPEIPDNQVYAPNYKNGENVVLIRYPHAGKFEAASLTVNNDLAGPKKAIPNAKDAVGISNAVAKKLSGADFDGDTVLVIPNDTAGLKVSPSLKQLEGFDPSESYPAYDGMPRVGKEDGFNKQLQMGTVSNLITDMTLKRASDAEIARAVKHSMVVIDAEKHNLNWKQSEADNDIAGLREKYSGGADKGASTLISRAKSPTYVNQRSLRFDIDPLTGEKVYRETGELRPVFKKGSNGERVPVLDDEGNQKMVPRTTKLPKMATVKNAYDLASDPDNPLPMEKVYADYANSMKALGNKARKAYLDTPNQERNPSAAKTYANEVASLTSKLNNALKNKPLERQAQSLANVIVKQKTRANPEMSKADKKRLQGQALTAARIKTGAQKQRIKIEPKEWEAIQAGAISHTKLRKILDNTDMDMVKSYATPKRNSRGMSASQMTRARTMMNSGKYTQAEVAAALGISVSSVAKAVE